MQDQRIIYFLGSNISHAISNYIHNDAASSIGYTNWRLEAVDTTDLEDFSKRKLTSPEFAGAVITMPHKLGIIPYLDEVDEIVELVGACNNIYPSCAPGSAKRRLIGTNTDWVGVRDCLLRLDDEFVASNSNVTHDEKKTGFIVGAGGACRAAIYALTRHLSVTRIYIINRDADEVRNLQTDISARYHGTTTTIPEIIHLQTPEQARSLGDKPYYGVGTVPDYAPATDAETTARDTLRALLDRSVDKKRGVFLDMCYNPRETSSLRAARECGWVTGEGVDVVSLQLKEQWRLWAGEEASAMISSELMVRRAREIADGHV
ncbi:uncharacterized protein BHQ10_007834 [Talaromyces amestolkiae]|uniref:Shikimate dehydrogenase substrate binding N-terminal domain-containing protein n=1 Tax=Talaromyces amestolkiae TaxID=1196081 RepID=A0A364L7P8_TALAM|nr:uncharacterized protein BHQ10_007834 [Talaromyces amestolkiae]RAO71822.1 hypothetical protein BHQ10_007834 [Talaromyces amestolkiae]